MTVTEPGDGTPDRPVTTVDLDELVEFADTMQRLLGDIARLEAAEAQAWLLWVQEKLEMALHELLARDGALTPRRAAEAGVGVLRGFLGARGNVQ